MNQLNYGSHDLSVPEASHHQFSFKKLMLTVVVPHDLSTLDVIVDYGLALKNLATRKGHSSEVLNPILSCSES